MQQQPNIIYQQTPYASAALPAGSVTPVAGNLQPGTTVPAGTRTKAKAASKSYRMSCRIWVSPTRPRAHHTVTVTVTTAKGSWVQSRARFAHGDWYQWRTHAAATSRFYYNIGSPRYGFRVHELVTVSNGSRKGKCQTSWLPMHKVCKVAITDRP